MLKSSLDWNDALLSDITVTMLRSLFRTEAPCSIWGVCGEATLRVACLQNHTQQKWVHLSEPAIRGRQKVVTPNCSDFPLFFRFVPICVPCFREYADLFRFAPFSSDLFRFVFRTNQNKSEKPLSVDPFCESRICVSITWQKDLGVAAGCWRFCWCMLPISDLLFLMGALGFQSGWFLVAMTLVIVWFLQSVGMVDFVVSDIFCGYLLLLLLLLIHKGSSFMSLLSISVHAFWVYLTLLLLILLQPMLEWWFLVRARGYESFRSSKPLSSCQTWDLCGSFV